MIRRHSATAIAIHWFNALCWIFLLFSGFALLSNPAVQPVGQWWSDLWADIFGLSGLLLAHVAVGLVWIGVYLLYLLCRMGAEAWPFIREITDLDPVPDLLWTVKKGLWLLLGARAMRRLGIDPALPPQGFYNAGQKLVAIIAVAASLALMLTGGLMLYLMRTPGAEAYLQWCLLIHLAAAGLMAIFLPVHIYMAAFAPGEGPALRSMFTGFVPGEFARSHNPLWFAKLRANDPPRGEQP